MYPNACTPLVTLPARNTETHSRTASHPPTGTTTVFGQQCQAVKIELSILSGWPSQKIRREADTENDAAPRTSAITSEGIPEATGNNSAELSDCAMAN